MTNKMGIMVSILMLVLLITGCTTATSGEAPRWDTYHEARVQYVGDNSKVVNLLNILKADQLGDYTIALSTDEEPHGLTINYSELKDGVNEEELKDMEHIDYAFYLLALIDNVGYVDINYEGDRYHLDIKRANKAIHGNIKDYGRTPEELEKLNEKLSLLK